MSSPNVSSPNMLWATAKSPGNSKYVKFSLGSLAPPARAGVIIQRSKSSKTSRRMCWEFMFIC
jgi:hypothetical protein